MSGYTLWKLYSTVVMFIGLLIWSLERIIRRKSVIPRSVPLAEAKEETKRRINIVVKTVALCMAIYCNYHTTWPAIKDLPYVMEGEYLTVEGFADSSHTYKTNAARERGIYVKTEDEKVYVRVIWRGISKGAWVKINYLPNTRYGTMVEWRE